MCACCGKAKQVHGTVATEYRIQKYINHDYGSKFLTYILPVYLDTAMCIILVFILAHLELSQHASIYIFWDWGLDSWRYYIKYLKLQYVII